MKNKSFIFYINIIVYLFGALYFVKSQNINQIEILTTDQGLPFRDVKSIAQDSVGLMWFGTQQGLSRYDGYNFKVYNNNKENPNFIEKDKVTDGVEIVNGTNELWYVANNQIFKLNISNDISTSYTEKSGVKGEVLFIYKDAKEQIWIVSEDNWEATANTAKQYLQRYNGVDAFETIAEVKRGSREFTSITSDRDHNIYWGTILRGVLKFSEKGDFLSEQKITSFNWYGQEMFFGQTFFDKANNHYYFRKREKGILKFNDTTQSFKEYYNFQETIYHAIEDHQGSLWFAGQEALYRIDTEGNFQNFTKELKAHLDFSRINDLFQDSNNLLWIATDNGLFKIRIKAQLFTQLFKSDNEGWGNTFRGIFETNEGKILAMGENQYKLVGCDSLGNTFDFPLHHSIKNTPTPMAASKFFAFNKDKTAVYSINDNLIKIRLNDGLITIFPEFNSRLNITSGNPIIALKNGNLLFGYSLSKLTIFNPETNKSSLVFSKLEPENNISDLRFFLESKEPDIIWIGTHNNGLLKVNVNGSIEAHYNTKSNPSLSKNTILTLFEEEHKLWIGTYGGGLDCLLFKEATVTSFKKEQGLSDDNVVGILPYKKDFLWLSTYNGLSLFNKATLNFQNFYIEDGLTHNEFNYSSYFIDSNKNYYFGGMNGITKFNPKPILQKTELPPLLFINSTRFNSNTNKIISNDLSMQHTPKIEISPYNHYFTIDWTLPNYFKNVKHKYYTKLEGFEDRWFFQGNTASIRYNKLPAGDYVLKVKATDSNGNFSSNTLSMPIYVEQIFYKKWWFISLVSLFFIGIGYSIFNYRLQQVKAIEALRTKISSDLHDDVGSLLSGLAMQTEMLALNATEKDKPKLSRITAISRDAITKMRDLVWSIDNRRERILDLIERMNELADEMLLPKNIKYQINKGNLNSNKKLPIAVKQHLFFIYKEAVTNILRHSNANKVTVNFKNKMGKGYVIIKDNGTKNIHNSKTGQGLENMKMRSEKLNGTIRFYNKEGFTISIRLPFAL